jgi:hypothetical protein
MDPVDRQEIIPRPSGVIVQILMRCRLRFQHFSLYRSLAGASALGVALPVSWRHCCNHHNFDQANLVPVPSRACRCIRWLWFQ